MLQEFLDEHSPPDMQVNRLFYLSLPPNVFGVVSELTGEILRSPTGWSRLVVEKVPPALSLVSMWLGRGVN